MSVKLWTATASVDGGGPIGCEFKIEREYHTLSTRLPRPDKSWTFVDAAGHFHGFHQKAADKTHVRDRYPTLNLRTRQAPCHGCVHDCDGEYDEDYFVCRICGEEIEPGLIHGEHTWTEPGLYQWTAVAYAPFEPGREYSLRVTHTTAEYFGVALATDLEQTPFDGARTTFIGNGPLGERKVTS